MSENPMDLWEARLQETARLLAYPQTPDIAAGVNRRLISPLPARRSRPRLAWALIVLLVLAAGLLSVPPVRAAFLEFLQVGGIRIFLASPTATPTPPPPTFTPIPQASPGTDTAPSAVPSAPTATPFALGSLLDLGGETTLEKAQVRVSFPIRLPTYPAGLGDPDRVYVQDMGGPMLVLVWLDSNDPERVQLSLHMFGTDSWAGEKSQPYTLQETTVNGQYAVWAVGPYLLKLRSGDLDIRRLIDGHVLIWTEADLTYRLETDLTLEEAVRIAESLR